MISPWVLHRHHRLWDEPERFDPSRFLPDARQRIDRFAYLPFGAGPRICIGINFAQVEIKAMMSLILRRYTLELVEDQDLVQIYRGTGMPLNGIKMRVKPRQ